MAANDAAVAPTESSPTERYRASFWPSLVAFVLALSLRIEVGVWQAMPPN